MSLERTKSKRIGIFNHKGGVGKTTLTVNIACALADLGKRVLLIDSDPQCNLTSYLVESEVVDGYLDESDSEDGITVWSALRPVSEAEGSVRITEPLERFENIYLVPGDIRLSEFESDLNEFWRQCIEGRAKGYRGMTALSTLVNELSAKLDIDYVFYDTGPNIGPLNRTILLDCDYFIVPAACDLFSQRALKTLGRKLAEWVQNWARILDLAPQDAYLLPGKPKFLGFIPQGFRVYGGEPTKEFSYYLSQIEKDIRSQVVEVLNTVDPELVQGSVTDFKLGEIKYYGGVVPASQTLGVPISETKAGSRKVRAQAREAFKEIASKIVQRTSEAS